jgi:pilus assembly protein CpaD
MKKSFKYLSHSTTLFALLAISSALSGCMTESLDAEEAMIQPVAYSGSDTHPISVVKGPMTLEVSSVEGTLQPQQMNAVSGFAHQAKQAGVTPITVSRPSGGGSSARIASEVANLISQQGISRRAIRVISYPAPADAPVLVSYISTYAQTKACGDWSRDITDTTDSKHMPNHGCAVQSNIAAMISNPETLVVPATPSSIRANTRVNAIRGLEKDTSSRNSFWSIFN